MSLWKRKKDRPVVDPPSSGTDTEDNARLVDAMRAVAAHDDESSRAALFRLLLDASLIVSTPDEEPFEGARVAGSDERLRVATTQGEDGATVLPVFTSEAALTAWHPEGSVYTRLPADVLLQLALDLGVDRIVIDPASTMGGWLTGGEIAALAHGRLPVGGAEVAPAGTGMSVVGPSTRPPETLVQAIDDALAAEPAAQAAFLFQLRQEDRAPEVVVGVVLRDGTEPAAEDAAIRHIVDAAAHGATSLGSLIFMAVDPGTSLGAAIVASGLEIFRR